MKTVFLLLLLIATVAATPVEAQHVQPQHLAELFCSFGCSNCPGPDSNYYHFADTSGIGSTVEIINYHNSIADLTDKFYLESKADVDARDGSSFYNVSANPAAFIDGFVSQSTPYEWVSDTKADINFPLAPIMPIAFFGSDGLIHITFTATGPSSGSGTVNVALKESNIYYPNPETSGYGNPPGDIWNDIFRAMLSNLSDTMQIGANQTKSFDLVYDPTNQYPIYGSQWVTQNMEAVVFVQDNADDGAGNFVVESIGDVSLANLSGVASTPSLPAASIRTAGTPSNSDLVVSLPSSARASIVISDMLGRNVSTIPETMMPAGQTSIDLSGNALSPGCYFARLTVNGEDSGNTKFIIAP